MAEPGLRPVSGSTAGVQRARTGHDTDVVVVGAGPVGLATAIQARLAGLGVVVVDPREGAVDKACGEGLMPGGRRALERLGVDLRPGRDAMALRGIRYLSPGHGVSAPFRDGSGLGVRRTTLSAALALRAKDLGVLRVTARAELPVQGDDWVATAGVRASWCVAADGLHSPIRRGLGLARRGPERPRYGLRRHYAVQPWSDLVEVLWARDAEAYVTPVAPDVVGVAVLSRTGTGFAELLARFPGLQERLDGAEPASRVRGAGPLRQDATRRVHGRVLLAGDAAGYVDALTGEGISVGLAGARELVRCIAADRPQDYEQAWRRATRRYRTLTRSLLWATDRPLLRGALVPAAQRLPRLFGAVVDQLA